jgi:phage tail-like protein
MTIPRYNPYPAFNFQVRIEGVTEGEDVYGGFSDVSGLGSERNYSEYRNGNELPATTRKIGNTYKQDDVVLKRGLLGADNLFKWFKEARDGRAKPRSVTITLLDEARENPVATWVLTNAQPKKWTGPTLAAKGGGEVAMEELSLVHEGIVYE